MPRKLELCQKTLMNNEHQKELRGYRTDFITCVGSDLWGMAQETSDIDLFLGGRTEGGGLPLVEQQRAGTIMKTADKPGGLAGSNGYILE